MGVDAPEGFTLAGALHGKQLSNASRVSSSICAGCCRRCLIRTRQVSIFRWCRPEPIHQASGRSSPRSYGAAPAPNLFWTLYCCRRRRRRANPPLRRFRKTLPPINSTPRSPSGGRRWRGAARSLHPRRLIRCRRCPEIGALTQQDHGRSDATGASRRVNRAAAQPAPAVAFLGMTLALNGAEVATFALPQFSWEPMESTAPGADGPIACDPAFDGYPLLVAAPDNQQLVPFAPAPVLQNNIDNVAAGRPFASLFSLPFGLDAVIVQGNEPSRAGVRPFSSREAGLRPICRASPIRFRPVRRLPARRRHPSHRRARRNSLFGASRYR